MHGIVSMQVYIYGIVSIKRTRRRKQQRARARTHSQRVAAAGSVDYYSFSKSGGCRLVECFVLRYQSIIGAVEDNGINRFG